MRLSLHVTNEETEEGSLTVSHLSSQKSQGQFCSQASSLWVHLLLCPSGRGFLWLHLRLGRPAGVGMMEIPTGANVDSSIRGLDTGEVQL